MAKTNYFNEDEFNYNEDQHIEFEDETEIVLDRFARSSAEEEIGATEIPKDDLEDEITPYVEEILETTNEIVTELELPSEPIKKSKNSKAEVVIIEAKYGANGKFVDAKDKISANNQGRKITNGFIGSDPIPGVPKKLFIKWTVNGVEHSAIVSEKDKLDLKLP